MLTRIKIKKLFNIYDYDIDLSNSDKTTIKFITAPNGYGKTTLLYLIHAAMRQSYDKMLFVPFGQFELYYDEASSDVLYRYTVIREEETSESVNTDLTQTISRTLDIKLHRIIGAEVSTATQF